MPTVRVSDVAIFYQQLGRGQDLVLVHGLAAHHASWPLEVLLSLARHHRVTTFDLRGHGQSGMPNKGYTVKRMAQDLAEFLEAVKVRNAFLIGHSFGGLIALQYLLHQPHRVAKAVIVDVRHRRLQPRVPFDQWPGGACLREGLIESKEDLDSVSAEAGLWVLEQLAKRSQSGSLWDLCCRESFIPFGGPNGARRSAHHWIQLLETTTLKGEILADPGFDPSELAGLACPLLAVYGQKSPFLENLNHLSRIISHMEYKIISGAGHFLPWTHTQIFLETVLAFFEPHAKTAR